MTDTEVAVVGAGLAGAAAAWALARRGVQVVVLEQFEPAGPWGASHGRARIFRLAYPDPLYVGLARAALPLWRDLERASGVDVLTLTGAVDHGDPVAQAALATELRAAGEEHETLTATQAHARWPGLAFDGNVLHHPRAGRLDAEAAVHAFLTAARAAGAGLRTAAAVERLEVRAGDDVRVHTATGTVRARQVVVAAGGWTPGLLDGVPGSVLPALRLTQEQPALFAPVEAPWPSFIHHLPQRPEDGVYGLGGTEGVKVGRHGVGPVVRAEDRASDAARIDEAELARLVTYARRWLPGVDVDRATAQTCTYATTPDGDFAIGRSGPVTVATGFSGHGFKFGPVIGELVAGHVLGPDALTTDAPGTQPRLSAELHAAAAARFCLPRRALHPSA